MGGGGKGYAKNPFRLFIKILLKVPKLKKQAAIIASMYIVIKEKVEEDRALSTVQAIITPIAIAVQLGNFRYAETGRSFENLKKYHEMAISEGPTRTNKMEIVESSDEKYHFRVNSCLHIGIYKRLGVPELTRIMCNVDNAIYNIYSPDKIRFHRNSPGHTIK